MPRRHLHRQFIIGNSESLTTEELQTIINSNEYSTWYPKINTERNDKGNLTISLSQTNPNRDKRIGKRIVDGSGTGLYVSGTKLYVSE